MTTFLSLVVSNEEIYSTVSHTKSIWQSWMKTIWGFCYHCMFKFSSRRRIHFQPCDTSINASRMGRLRIEENKQKKNKQPRENYIIHITHHSFCFVCCLFLECKTSFGRVIVQSGMAHHILQPVDISESETEDTNFLFSLFFYFFVWLLLLQLCWLMERAEHNSRVRWLIPSVSFIFLCALTGCWHFSHTRRRRKCVALFIFFFSLPSSTPVANLFNTQRAWSYIIIISVLYT